MVYEVLYERVADITAVDWKAAAEKWPMWFAEKCEAEFLVEQSAKRLKLSAYRARMWQEGVTTKPAAPEDFGLYAHAPVADKPVLVALEALEVAPASRIDVEKVNALCDLLLTRKDVKTVMVSAVGSTLWETLMRTAGYSLVAIKGSCLALQMRPSPPFARSSDTQLPQACDYMPYIQENIQGSFNHLDYLLCNIRQDPDFLSVTGMESLLGCSIRGTSDVGLLARSSVVAGLASNGTKWIWLVQPVIAKGLQEGFSAEVVPVNGQGQEAGHLVTAACNAASQPGSGAQPLVGTSLAMADLAEGLLCGDLTKYKFQALTCLVLANLHAPHERPIVTLTDLNDFHVLFWLDGHALTYYAAPDAATAWALTRALLAAEQHVAGASDGSRASGASVDSSCIVQRVVQRQKLEVMVEAGADELEQLADIADCLDPDDVRASQGAIMLRQLFAMPAFSAVPGSGLPGT